MVPISTSLRGLVTLRTIRDEFKKYVSPFVNYPSDYCFHSLKSGGASNHDGYKLSDPELKDRHAGSENPLRGVTPSVLMLRCLKLLKAWVSKLFFGQWRVRVCVLAPPRFPVPFDKGYVGFSCPHPPDTTRLM